MSDDSPTKAKPRSRSRLSIRVTTILQIIFCAVFVIALNLLSCQEYKRKDLTLDNSYELSELTEKLLNSEKITDRQEPVKLIVAFRRSSPYFTRLTTIAEEYRRLGNGHITVEIVDPQAKPNRANEISTQYRLDFIDDLIIVDARSGDEAVFTEVESVSPKETPSESAQRQLELSAHVRFLDPEDIAVFASNNATGRELIEWQDEDALSAAILSAVEGNVRRFYFISDKSDMTQTGTGTPWQVVSTILYNQNIALIPIKISEINEIPADADGVAIIAPRFDFDDREIEILREYWLEPRSSICVMLSAGHRPDNLRTFLRENGVTPRNDRILTVQNNRTINSVRGTFTHGPALNAILGGKSTEFDGTTASLEVRENAPDLVSQGIAPIALIEANKGYWGESDFTKENPTFDRDSDTESPLYVAAAVIRGNANDDQLASQTSRMVVVSNTDFLNGDKLREQNVDFVRSAAQWMIGSEELMGVGPKKITTRRISLLNSQINFITRVTLFFMPVIALIIGAIVWNIRRR